MNDTATRPLTAAAAVGGLIITVIGAAEAISPDIIGGVCFATAGVAALLCAVGVFGARRVVDRSRVSRIALGVGTGTLTLFGLAHFYAMADQDRGVALFSAFMVLSAVSLIVAGAAAMKTRAGTPLQRTALLVTGIWPIATIPAGAAIGDLPHFLAIAVWGGCWMVTGVAMVRGHQVAVGSRLARD
jgi:hypothetical protein